MKKTQKIIAFIGASLLTMTSFVGCKSGNSIDENTIVFSVFNGGYGKEYAQNIANAWNEANKDTGFEVSINPNKDEWYTIAASLSAGTALSDIYETTILTFDEAASKGWIEDLTDVYNTKAEGESKTIREKVKSSEEQNMELYMVDGKYYSIPVSTDVCGFVYDHEIFLEKGFLISAETTASGGAKLISSPTEKLSIGRDGIEGSMDDGHPKNMAEYNLMIDAIKSSMYSYVWSGKFPYYLSPLFDSIMIEYEGFADWKDMLDYDFTYGDKVVTRENGYEIFSIDGRLKALQFIDNYLADSTLYHPQAAKSTSHTDVQKTFVYGNAFNGTTADKQVAFLYEGIWWENEARANFNSLANRGYNNYEFGKRNYRMMMLPQMDENQEHNDYVFGSFGSLNMVVKKQSNPEKLKAIKSFLTMFYSNYWLRETTVNAGMIVPFDCELDTATLARGTQFLQNMYQILNQDNVYVYRKEWNTRLVSAMETSYIGNRSYLYPINAMQRGDGLTVAGNAQDLFSQTYDYNKKEWKSILEG